MISSDIGVRGGAEVFVESLSYELTQLGHKVDLRIIPSAHGSRAKAILRHVEDIYNPSAVSEIRRRLRATHYDIVHVHNFHGLSTAIFAEIRRHAVSVVWTVHDYRILCYTGMFMREGKSCSRQHAVCRALYNLKKIYLSDKVAIVAPSEYLRDALSRYIKYDIQVIRNGTSHPAGVDGLENVSVSNQIRLGYIGRLTDEKGVEELASAVSSLDRDDVHLDVVGDGPSYQRLLLEYSSSSRVRMLGSLGGESKWRWFAELDALVVPSLWPENAPLVVYEAIGMKLPIIASKVGGIPEVVQNGVNGILVESNAWTEVLSCISKGDLLRLKSQMKEIEIRDMSIVASEYEQLYRSL